MKNVASLQNHSLLFQESFAGFGGFGGGVLYAETVAVARL
jgi:hypothetical protein